MTQLCPNRIIRLLIVLVAVLALAACAPIQTEMESGPPAAPPPAEAPLPQVQFSEMVSETTLTAQAVALVEEGGRVIPLSVAYDGGSHRALLLPHTPLQGGTWYTATVAASVTDLAGNPLAAATSWRFRTVEATVKVYLPLVMKER